MKTWKKNIMAAAVLVTVCAGIYLNWIYTQEEASKDLSDTLDSEKVMSDDGILLDSEAQDVNTVTDYFAAVRLSRQQARDSAVSLIQEAMSYNEEGSGQQSNEQLEQIVETALCEAQIESLIIAKGYAECVAYISENGISVAVATPEGGLQQADVAVIADIVVAQSDYEVKDIRVVEVM